MEVPALVTASAGRAALSCLGDQEGLPKGSGVYLKLGDGVSWRRGRVNALGKRERACEEREHAVFQKIQRISNGQKQRLCEEKRENMSPDNRQSRSGGPGKSFERS